MYIRILVLFGFVVYLCQEKNNVVFEKSQKIDFSKEPEPRTSFKDVGAIIRGLEGLQVRFHLLQ